MSLSGYLKKRVEKMGLEGGWRVRRTVPVPGVEVEGGNGDGFAIGDGGGSWVVKIS